MSKSKYSYSILHYVHDAFSGERINVAVAVLSANPRVVQVKIPASLQRLRLAYPDCDTTSLKDSLRAFERQLQAFFRTNSESSLAEALECVLPLDDQAFITSKVGVGITNDLAEESEHLLERFVTRYDTDFTDAEITRKIITTPNLASEKVGIWTTLANNNAQLPTANRKGLTFGGQLSRHSAEMTIAVPTATAGQFNSFAVTRTEMASFNVEDFRFDCKEANDSHYPLASSA